jgi:hypothetical protein
LNSSYGLLQDDPFDVVSDIGSLIPYFNPSTRWLNILIVSIGSSTSKSNSPPSSISIGSPTEEPMTFDQLVEVNRSSHVSFLPRWVSQRIEATEVDVGDSSFRGQTRIQKKHASVDMMTCVFETYDLVTYSDVEGQPGWEKAMQT